MKKTLIVLTLCCFTLAIFAMNPTPVLAADEFPLVPVLIGIVVVVGGVIGLTYADRSDEQQAAINKYNPKLGKWTYDEMLAELGSPSAVTEGKSSTLVEYYKSKNINVGKTVYHEGYYFNEDTAETESEAVTRYIGPKISLYFDKDKKILKGWQYENYNQDGTNLNWSAKSGDLSFIPAPIGKPSNPFSAAPVQVGEKTLEQKLKDLNGLKDKKLITAEEYKAARQKLLDNAVK